MDRSEDMSAQDRETDQPQDGVDELDELARALPRRLVGFVARLGYLTPDGQELALQALGPGSRLVLEALGLVRPGSPPGLTEQGGRLCERLLAGLPPEVAGATALPPVSVPLRSIARVTPVKDGVVVLAFNDDPEQPPDQARRVVYELSPEAGAQSAAREMVTIEVARSRRGLKLWQRTGLDTVVVREPLAALPRIGELPYLLPLSEADEAPSEMFRKVLGLREEPHG